MAQDDPPDPLDQHVDRLWEHLQTQATPGERAAWEQVINAKREGPLRWRLLGFLGIKPPSRRLPPVRLEGQSTRVLQRRHPPGSPRQGFFSASAEDVDQSVVEEGPWPGFDGVEVKMMSPVEVATLGQILGAGAYDELVEQITNSGREGKGGTHGVYRVSTQIRDRLAEAEVETVAPLWGATEELQASHWEPAELHEFLSGLRGLAGQARAEGKELWVWWSA